MEGLWGRMWGCGVGVVVVWVVGEGVRKDNISIAKEIRGGGGVGDGWGPIGGL